MAASQLVRLVVGSTLVIALGSPAMPEARAAGDREFLNRAAHAFNEITERAMPAVVSISTIKSITPEEAAFGAGDETPFDPTEPDQGPLPGIPDGKGRPHAGTPDLPGAPGENAPRSMGVGSGIIIREDGIVMTNNHVVQNAEKITVSLGKDDERKITNRSAVVLGTDPKSDLAILKLERKPGDPAQYPVLRFGNSAETKVGDWAIAIGSPFGLSRSVSFGIISYIGRGNMGVLDVEDFIQTDAAINPGSSGGPLLNAQGEIIGINTAIFSQGGSFTGIGFAIPSKLAQTIVAQLVEHGRVLRGWLGVTAQDLDEELARHFSVPGQKGALVSSVNEKSPAADATLRTGDVILSFNGAPVTNSNELKDLVGKTPKGKKVAIRVIRKGTVKELSAIILEEPRPKLPAAQLAGQAAPLGAKPESAKKPSLESLGLAVEDLPAEIAAMLGPSVEAGALVVGIRMGSAAFDAGLAPGDIILKANETEIEHAADLAKATKKLKPGQPAVFYVQRGPDSKLFVPVKTGS